MNSIIEAGRNIVVSFFAVAISVGLFLVASSQGFDLASLSAAM